MHVRYLVLPTTQNISASIPFSTVERMSDDSSNIIQALNRAYLVSIGGL